MSPDDPQVRRFLADSMIARVAALSPRGRPFMTPIWFVCDGGRVCLPTGKGSLAVRYLTARPEAVLLFDGERGTERGRVLRLCGRAAMQPLTGSPALLIRLAVKYYLTSFTRGLLPQLRHLALVHRYHAQGTGSVVVAVAPYTAEFLAAAA